MIAHLWIVCLIFWAYHAVQAWRTMPDAPSGRHLAYMWAWWAATGLFIFAL